MYVSGGERGREGGVHKHFIFQRNMYSYESYLNHMISNFYEGMNLVAFASTSKGPHLAFCTFFDLVHKLYFKARE